MMRQSRLVVCREQLKVPSRYSRRVVSSTRYSEQHCFPGSGCSKFTTSFVLRFVNILNTNITNVLLFFVGKNVRMILTFLMILTFFQHNIMVYLHM